MLLPRGIHIIDLSTCRFEALDEQKCVTTGCSAFSKSTGFTQKACLSLSRILECSCNIVMFSSIMNMFNA